MSTQDIRWIQRFNNYRKALSQLTRGVQLYRQRPLSEIEQQGLIKAVEFTHELAWNVMKDYFSYQGNTSIMGARDATREAFRTSMVSDGEGWMEMIKSRNMTSHTYNQEIAKEITERIVSLYHTLLLSFEKTMQNLMLTDWLDRIEYGLKQELIRKINAVFASHPQIEYAILFGSRAKGDYHPGSDIDLALKGDTITLAQLFQIENQLDDLLLPYKIDLCLLHKLDNTDLIDHIQRVGILFYAGPEMDSEYELSHPTC
jgi:nucleotidyltransferase substrate binding protein (TIGR01987 family)